MGEADHQQREEEKSKKNCLIRISSFNWLNCGIGPFLVCYFRQHRNTAELSSLHHKSGLIAKDGLLLSLPRAASFSAITERVNFASTYCIVSTLLNRRSQAMPPMHYFVLCHHISALQLARLFVLRRKPNIGPPLLSNLTRRLRRCHSSWRPLCTPARSGNGLTR